MQPYRTAGLEMFLSIRLKADPGRYARTGYWAGIGDFKPEYAGQLNFYLSAVDGILKKELENNSIRAISQLTEKELRQAHNLQKMYKAGAFNGR